MPTPLSGLRFCKVLLQPPILYPATCGPEGNGSGSATAIRQSTAVKYIFLIPIPDQYPSTRPQNLATMVGLPYPLFPNLARKSCTKRKGKGNIYKRQRKGALSGRAQTALLSFLVLALPSHGPQNYLLQFLSLLLLHGGCHCCHPSSVL